MTDKEKIFNIIREFNVRKRRYSTYTEPNDDEELADALLANGNFLVEIFRRKLERCKTEKDGLKALASIFAIDIQADNVNESRARLKAMYLEKFPNASDFALYIVDLTLKNNIRCGDSLKIMEKWTGGEEE